MNRYIHILLLSFLMFCACSLEGDMYDVHNESHSVISIMGHPKTYSKKVVDSKAAMDEEYISNMTMLIFDSAGGLVGKPITVHDSEPVFVIDTESQEIGSMEDDDLTPMGREGNQAVLDAAVIYIVANAEEYFGGTDIRNLSDMNEINVNASGITMPTKGFPMIGWSEPIDLSKDRDKTSGDVVREIPLDKLYAKVDVNIRVQAAQTGTQTPSFTLDKYVISNVPKTVTLGQSDEETINVSTGSLGDFISTSISAGKKTVLSSSSTSDDNYMTLSFYVPEFKVIPDNLSYSYPAGVDTDLEKQKFKPELLGDDDCAPCVSVYGTYNDHSGNPYNVKYDIFLGEDSVDDFHVERNRHLVNNVVIRGITNHNNSNIHQDKISIDYRVEIDDDKKIVIQVERESMLDAHFEVRPMDVYVTSTNGFSGNQSIEVKVGDDCKSWVKFEPSEKSKNYFYTDLLTNGGLLDFHEINGNKARIWFYIDENLNIGSRQGTITFTYKENGVPVEIHNITLTQVGLLLVDQRWNDGGVQNIIDDTEDGGGENFYIESFEEYLHHFDPLDLPSTNRIYNGLPWANGTNHSNIGGDYYNNYYRGDEATPVIVRTYSGSEELKLSDIPKSAAEYCWNKNKRDNQGKVTTTSGTWYLPGIREMEAAFYEYYSRFHEFQENFYWSSAPGKKQKYILGFIPSGYEEYTEKARATKAEYEDGVFSYVESDGDKEGSRDRGEVLRIRCAYKPK